MHPIEKIRAEHGAPFYIYDGKVISEQASILKNTFPGFGILFSIKANPFMPVLKKMASLGIGADAASAKEVDLAIDAGMKEIYYSCPAPTKEDIDHVLDKCRIIADSFHVLTLLEEAAAARSLTLAVGLRIHPDFTMDGSPQMPSKFGIDESLVWKTDFRKAYPHLTINGLHIHIRSQVLDTEQLGNYYENVLALAIHLQNHLGNKLNYINFGGGVGKVYDAAKQDPLDFKKLQQTISSIKEKYKNELSTKFLLESGRFLACDCGTYVTEIVDIKESHGKKFYIVKNGANGFFKPVLRQMLLPFHPDQIGASYEPFATENDSYEIHVLSDSNETEIVDIAGHLCSGADIMAKDVKVKKGTIGDLVTFNHAGSYAYSLAPLLFASQPMPKEFFIDE
ncbi:hypothetical protein [Anaerotignum sp.]